MRFDLIFAIIEVYMKLLTKNNDKKPQQKASSKNNEKKR